MAGDAPRSFTFLGFHLSLARRRLTDPSGHSIRLRSRVFDLLELLLEHPGEALEKHAIMDRVWPDTCVAENNLNQAVSELRRALGDDWRAPRFIVTLPRRGYQFVARVEVSDPARAGVPRPAAVSTSAVLPRGLQGDVELDLSAPMGRRITITLTMIGLLLAALPVANRSAPPRTLAAPLERMIAVIDTSVRSNAAERVEYRSDGSFEYCDPTSSFCPFARRP